LLGKRAAGGYVGNDGKGDAMTTKQKKIPIDKIVIDGGTQARVAIDTQVVADYGAAMDDGAQFPPVDVFFDGSTYWLADGFHRLLAAQGRYKAIPATVHTGTQRDAVLYAAGANDGHGLRRSNKDKRRAVEILLADPVIASWSNELISEAAKVGHSLVADVRRQLSESEGCQQVEKRVGKDGKARKYLDQQKLHPVAADSDDNQDADGGAVRVTDGQLAEMEPDPVGVSKQGAAAKFRERLIGWTEKQFDNIDDLSWQVAASVFLQLGDECETWN
jgi:hypothetical protein